MTSVSQNRHILAQTSRECNASYSPENIEPIDDYDALFDIADEIGVNLEGLNDLEDIKERLIMHLEKPNGNFRDKIASLLENINRDDAMKTKEIVKLLVKCQKVLEKFETNEDVNGLERRGSAALEDFLKTEGILKHSRKDFQDRIKHTESEDCIVVVSGETSAGKSSFLNLVLGETVLPVHHNPCTSVITRISYRERREVTIIYKSGEQEDIKELGEGQLQEKLWNKVYEKDIDQRENATLIKEVRLFLPRSLLKCGLVLVDSPGIGENEAMDKVIEEFVSVNDIMGFIYVIKSDNAGGVDEDRLGNLLKVIITHQKKRTEEGGLPFDPKCAIFLCNMWDLIKDDHKEEVYDYAVKKLGLYWPGLSQSQVLRFSTFRARREVSHDPDYIVTEFKLFLDCLHELVSRAMRKKIQSAYKWMEAMLIRSVHHLKTLVRRIDSSDKGMKDKMKEVHGKLTNLKKKSESVLKSQKQCIEEASKTICQSFRDELKKSQVHFRLVQWYQGETPILEKDEHWENIKFKIQEIMLRRISDEFNVWEEENEELKTLQSKIVMEIKTELSILKSDLDGIEDDLHSDTDSVSSDDSDMFGRRRSCGLKANRKMSLLDLTVIDSEILPVRLVSRFLHPIETIKDKIRNSRIYEATVLQRKREEYRKEPVLRAKKMSEKFLRKLLNPLNSNEDTLQIFINSNMEKPRELLEVIGRNIPDLIESNEKLMDHISHCLVNATENRTMYEQMMEELEKLKRQLMNYGGGVIYVNDFMAQHIKLSYDSMENDTASQFKVSDLVQSCSSSMDVSRRNISRGIYSAVQSCIYTPDAERKDEITVRVYLPLSGVTETYTEVTKLRLLSHDCLAEFLGIHHSDSPVPAFIYEDHLKSLKRYRMTTFANLQLEIPRIIRQIVMGIEYLHSKKMVHLELTTSTVTVNFNGDVKLTGGCLPRRASFPLDKETINASEFVYFCPDVLRGEIYVACADIYSLGLLIYELLLNTKAFELQRDMALGDFIQNVNPSEMLQFDKKFKEVEMTESPSNLVRWCLELKPDNRPTIQILLETVNNLSLEPCVNNMKRSHRRPVRKRSQQSELESCVIKL